MVLEMQSEQHKLEVEAKSAADMVGHETVFVGWFSDGILDPDRPMLGPVRDGGHIIANTAPGCWGPMITPAIRGGHEVTQPVAVAGAEVGDAIAIRIKDITVTSLATASGNDQWMEGRFLGDPYVAGRCPECDTLYPDKPPFVVPSVAPMWPPSPSPMGIRSPLTTIVPWASRCPMRLPGRLPARPSSMPPCPRTRFRLGTTPAIPIPDSHNAGDFGSFLIGAPHEYAITAEQLQHRTDGHMDIDAVRAGAILICPVKAPGGGVYLGDMHALQGDGEIAGHTCDTSGAVTLQVHLLKGLTIDGPLLFPVAEDLPYLARPLSEAEKTRALTVVEQWGVEQLEESYPISVIGSGPDLNAATDNGLERAAVLLDMTVPEVKNRATITGAIEIGRHPGVVQVTFRAPADRLRQLGLLSFAQDQYGPA
jgi:acetamidase/formamidase